MNIQINPQLINEIILQSKDIGKFLDLKNINNDIKGNLSFDKQVFLTKEELINTLIKDFLQNPSSKEKIINKIVKHNIIKNFDSFSNIIKQIYDITKLDILKPFLLQISNLDYQNLQQNIKTIQILDKLIKQHIQKNDTDNMQDNDNLQILLKELTQKIEFFQFYSILQNSFFTFLPFLWENLEDGNLEFKRQDNIFSCKIDLQLKQYGRIITKILYDNNEFGVSFFIEHNELKTKISKNISILKKMFFKQQMNLSHILVNSLTNNTPAMQEKLVEIFV